MPPAVSAFANRFAGTEGLSRWSVLRAGLIALPHVAALAILLQTEDDAVSQAAFVLAWGVLNCFWLVFCAARGSPGRCR